MVVILLLGGVIGVAAWWGNRHGVHRRVRVVAVGAVHAGTSRPHPLLVRVFPTWLGPRGTPRGCRYCRVLCRICAAANCLELCGTLMGCSPWQESRWSRLWHIGLQRTTLPSEPFASRPVTAATVSSLQMRQPSRQPARLSLPAA